MLDMGLGGESYLLVILLCECLSYPLLESDIKERGHVFLVTVHQNPFHRQRPIAITT